tara:strand:- start:60 stop:500 length:441 start_codon:yes stop_codon:yes gene_type:complete
LSKVILYTKDYLHECLDLFDSNTPPFFATNEKSLFKNYLAKDRINYYLFFQKKIIAAAGFEYEKKNNCIMLTWGMVHHQFHNQGYGTYMTEYRLEKIQIQYPGINIMLNTSQLTFKFYEKLGFKIIKFKKNGYMQGLDRYDMILEQ